VPPAIFRPESKIKSCGELKIEYGQLILDNGTQKIKMSVKTVVSSDFMANAVGKPSERFALAESAEYNRQRSAEEKGEDPTQTLQAQIVDNHMRLNNILRDQQEALINSGRSDTQHVKNIVEGHSLNILANAVKDTDEKAALAQAAEYNRKRAAEEYADSSKRIRSSPDARSAQEMIAEHMRLSIKLKEQQEALINSRRGSAIDTPYHGQASGQLYTPGGQFRGRSGSMQRLNMGNATPLPPMARTPMAGQGLKIWTESPFNKSPPMQWPSTSQPGNTPQPNISPPSAHLRRPAFSLTKDHFLKWCEGLFDAHEKSEILVAALTKQSETARGLINGLRSAVTSIETRVSKSFKEQNQKLSEKYVMALTDLHRRTAAIEEKLGSSSTTQPMSSEVFNSRTPSPRLTTTLSSSSTPSPKLPSIKPASPPPMLPE
jgi:hypothetical protein